MIYTAIDTFYLPEEQIRNSPSRKDGIVEDVETALRLYGCELIQESGILLKLPQAVMATGQVLFHRFYCKKSFARFNVKRVAASCVWLAAKLEESPRKIQHVLNVFHRMECRRENKSLELLDPFSKEYEELKIDLIRTERHLLKEMGFICHVEHPHKFIINYLTQLEAPPELMQDAWNLANDSLRTTLCVRFKSEVVACGVVHLASRRFNVPLPESPPWWRVFNAEKSEIDEVSRVLANLYRQPKGCYIEVSKDSKSFVLTSRAWDPPPECQEELLKVNSANGIPQGRTGNSSSGSRESIVKIALDKLKTSTSKESTWLSDEVPATTSNGELWEDSSGGKMKQCRDREDGIGNKNREKDRGRSKSRKRDRDQEWECNRTRDQDRGRETDRTWEKIKERYYRNKERSKDSGYSETGRKYSSV
eukprot:c28760_g1_i5 orf=413-1675(+)